MSRGQTELIQDFAGGLDTLSAPDRLTANRTPSALNCWYDDGALTKRPGQLKVSTVSNGDTILGRGWSGYSMHNSVFSGASYEIIYASIGTFGNILLYVPAASVTSSTQMSVVGAGTASSGTSSPTITGVGTNWNTTARVGSLISIGVTIGKVLTVDSDTQLTLTGNFGFNNSGASYKIFPQWSVGRRVSYVDMNSKTWICGNGSPTVSWDGTTLAYIDAFPQANYSISYSNYIFAANTTSNPSRVSWCALKDPTTWPASNFIDVSPDDGFPIVGMVLDGQSIVIFKTNSAWKLTGGAFDPANPTYSLTQIAVPSDFYINSPKTFQPLGGGFIMLCRNGFYSYNGSGLISKIYDFDKIRGEFGNMSWTWGNVPAVTAEPCAQIVDGNYWVQVPNAYSSIDSSHKELTYIIDKSGAVWKWQALGGGIISDFGYLNGILYGVNSYSGGTQGFIQLNTGNSDASNLITNSAFGTLINGTFSTKLYEFQKSQRFGIASVFFKKQLDTTASGTVSTAVGTAIVTGSGTNFLSLAQSGTGATITVNGVTKIISTVDSNTQITLTTNFGALNSGLSYSISGGTLLTFSYQIDESGYTSTNIDMTISPANSGGTRVKSVDVLIGQVGRTIQFKISNAVASQGFEFYGIEFVRKDLEN